MKKNYSFVRSITFFVALAMAFGISAQSVGINTDGSAPNTKSILDIKSSTMGMMIPRVTTANRIGIGATLAEQSMTVYDTDLKSYMVYNGSDWTPIGILTDYWTDNGTGLVPKNNRVLALNTFPSTSYKLSIDGGTGIGSYIKNDGATDKFSLLLWNKGGTTLKAISGGTGTTGYPVTPAAIYAIGNGTHDGAFIIGKESGRGVYAQSQGTGAALEAWALGTGLAGLFRSGDVEMQEDAFIAGRAGVGTLTPVAKMEVKGATGNNEHIVTATSNYSGNSDIRAFNGESITNPGYGIGGNFKGGFRGVYGWADGQTYTGTVTGVYGKASGSSGIGTRTGIFGTASGGITNWAGFFSSGNVYVQNDLRIGTTGGASGYRLSVDGKIMAEEIRVQNSAAWPDYVFTDTYELKSLKEVEKHINEKHHLPGIPSAATIEADGLHLGDMQIRMMEKIEELTLYIIEQNKRIEKLEKELVNQPR